ncbi:Leucine-rich repeat protein kinase family protein [Prunus dulcis]|uniref:Leucine-rich repeat protein kinase family protein n=1 Tax=Prunus dulcis TaxID=3755 RepID=A0A4Y1RF74_PRUDU|nr:Leucine-rich repeat protein kinase family protein [Prunus dulcis]
MMGALKSFIVESEALRNIRHRNLVKIITACSSADFQGSDNELTGHVADFGLARFLSKLSSNISANQISSIGIRGSVGYAAPDVYWEETHYYMFTDGLNLHNFVKMTLPIEIADAVLFLQGGIKDTPKQRSATAQKLEEFLSLIFRTGIECSAESSRDPKGISDAASALRSIRDVLL